MNLSEVAGRARVSAVLLGPAFVASIAYVDPGNVATNVAAGATHGYLLVWVVVVANLMACLVQFLSAKLGVVTGQSLPEALRDGMPRWGRLVYWGQAELVAMATDLAEVLGGAIALNILFDLPLLLGGVITGLVPTGLLAVQSRRGQQPFERAITGLFVSPPSLSETLGGLRPAFDGADSVLLAAGMLGATVMPHAVYLHSALARDRHGRPRRGPTKAPVDRHEIRRRIGDAAGRGGSTWRCYCSPQPLYRGQDTSGSLQGAHQAVRDTLGSTVALLFALALLASGLASTSVGC